MMRNVNEKLMAFGDFFRGSQSFIIINSTKDKSCMVNCTKKKGQPIMCNLYPLFPVCICLL